MKYLKTFEQTNNEPEIGDINYRTGSIILDKDRNFKYYKIMGMVFETDYVNSDKLINYKSIEKAYKFDNESVEKIFKLLYDNYKNFDMSTATQVKNVMDIWSQKIPNLKICKKK